LRKEKAAVSIFKKGSIQNVYKMVKTKMNLENSSAKKSSNYSPEKA
jgi:hypothetical protein